MLWIEPTARQDTQRGVHLTEVTPRSRDHDEQLRSSLGIQPSDIRIVQHARRLRRTSESSFGICHHGEIARIAGDPSCRAQLAEGLGPLLRAVGRDADRLSHRTDPGGSGAGRPRVIERPTRVVVEEQAGRGQVGADDLGVRLRQAAQVRAHLAIQEMDGGSVWDGGLPLSR